MPCSRSLGSCHFPFFSPTNPPTLFPSIPLSIITPLPALVVVVKLYLNTVSIHNTCSSIEPCIKLITIINDYNNKLNYLAKYVIYKIMYNLFSNPITQPLENIVVQWLNGLQFISCFKTLITRSLSQIFNILQGEKNFCYKTYNTSIY